MRWILGFTAHQGELIPEGVDEQGNRIRGIDLVGKPARPSTDGIKFRRRNVNLDFKDLQLSDFSKYADALALPVKEEENRHVVFSFSSSTGLEFHLPALTILTWFAAPLPDFEKFIFSGGFASKVARLIPIDSKYAWASKEKHSKALSEKSKIAISSYSFLRMWDSAATFSLQGWIRFHLPVAKATLYVEGVEHGDNFFVANIYGGQLRRPAVQFPWLYQKAAPLSWNNPDVRKYPHSHTFEPSEHLLPRTIKPPQRRVVHEEMDPTSPLKIGINLQGAVTDEEWKEIEDLFSRRFLNVANARQLLDKMCMKFLSCTPWPAGYRSGTSFVYAEVAYRNWLREGLVDEITAIFRRTRPSSDTSLAG